MQPDHPARTAGSRGEGGKDVNSATNKEGKINCAVMQVTVESNK
jgi:hypothetical protein